MAIYKEEFETDPTGENPAIQITLDEDIAFIMKRLSWIKDATKSLNIKYPKDVDIAEIFECLDEIKERIE